MPGVRTLETLDEYAWRISELDGVRRVDVVQGPAGDRLTISTVHEPYSVENAELAEPSAGCPARRRRWWAGRVRSWPTSGDVAVSGSLDALMPALLFGVAFGLSMGYEMLLLARITEEHRRTGDTRTAVATGLQRAPAGCSPRPR